METNALRHDAGADTQQTLRILVVEDDQAYAAFIATICRGSEFVRFDVEHVQTLAGAEICLRDAPFSVVLLDLGLGDARGLEGLNAVIAAVPDVPVIILSGEDDLALSLGAVKIGAQDYLLKARWPMLHLPIGYAIRTQESSWKPSGSPITTA